MNKTYKFILWMLALQCCFSLVTGCTSDTSNTPIATISNGTAKIKITLETGFGSSIKSAANVVAKQIYLVAKTNNVNQIVVSLYMSKRAVSDHYGNAWTEDRHMGDITVNSEDLAEIRKYKDYMSYTYETVPGIGTVSYYGVLISEMEYAGLLEK
jgi:hypothetical protein